MLNMFRFFFFVCAQFSSISLCSHHFLDIAAVSIHARIWASCNSSISFFQRNPIMLSMLSLSSRNEVLERNIWISFLISSSTALPTGVQLVVFVWFVWDLHRRASY